MITNVLYQCKILLREETGYRVYGNSLYYILPNFSTNLF